MTNPKLRQDESRMGEEIPLLAEEGWTRHEENVPLPIWRGRGGQFGEIFRPEPFAKLLLRLRPIGLALRVLRLRPIGLALRVLRLRPIGLALRVLRLRPIGLALRVLRLRPLLRLRAIALALRVGLALRATPSAALRWLRDFLLMRQPPLLCEEGNDVRFQIAPVLGFVKYVDALARTGMR